MKNYYKYLPITKTEEKWGFYITTVGHTKIPSKVSYPVKGHPLTHSFTWNKGRILNGYYIVFISHGQGIFESEQTRPFRITEGTCFFLFPNVWHRYKPDLNTGWEEYWVGFKGTYPDNLMRNNFFGPKDPFVTVGLHEPLLQLFQRLLDTVQSGKHGYYQIISGITLEILGLIHAISVHKGLSENPTQKLIHKAIFLLQESLEKQVDIEQLARQLPMGYSKFRKEFKKITGQPPNEYHLTLRLNKAKELLYSTTLNINEVAYQTGFESAYYFSRFFKKKNGMSPKLFRNAQNKLAN